MDYPDVTVKGLNLRVPAKGDWMWTLRMRDALGELRRFNLGVMTTDHGLAWARREAEKLRQGVRHGGQDPIRKKKEEREAARLTLEALVEDWRTLALAAKKPSYAKEAVRALRAAFKSAWGKPATALSAEDVRRVLEAMQRAGKAGIAAGTMRYGRAAFGWALRKKHVSVNPFLGQEAKAVASRERWLDDNELRDVMIAAAELGGTFGSIVQMLSLTGQRRDEVAAMHWSEISADWETWIIPSSRTKNGRQHVVALSTTARALLPADRGEGLVFPGEREGGVYSAWSQAKRRLDAKVVENRAVAAETMGGVAEPIPAWRLHDLRRTLASNFQQMGVRLETTERVLNHVGGSRAGIVGVYQRYEWLRERREALEAWGNRVTALVTQQQAGSGNVILLSRAG